MTAVDVCPVCSDTGTGPDGNPCAECIPPPTDPVYDDGQVTLYQGDCRTVLAELPNWSIDLIVTDPPYGQSWQSGRRNTRHDQIAGDDETAPDLIRAALSLALGRTAPMREHRHLYVFGRPDLTDLPVGATAELVWDKDHVGPGNLELPWGPSWEPITFAVHASRPSGRQRGDGRLAARLRRGSVLRVPRANAGQLEDRKGQHATPKPVELLRQLIESSSLLGETVLDPFAGGGSTLIAARAEGRRAIGIEIDPRECDRAIRNLEAHP